MFLFIGKDVLPEMLQNVFGCTELSDVTPDIPVLSNMHNTQIRNAISYLQALRPRYMHLNICRQGLDQSVENRFANLLLEDRNFDNLSYVDYLIQVHR
jgi:protein transport protein SEC24